MNARATAAFRAARDLLLRHREDYDAAYRSFRWPELDDFNWARDWFDVVAEGNDRTALWIVSDDGREVKRSYRELSEALTRVANALRDLGVQRGDRVLMMLGNELPLWETMLAAMKLGAVVIPATTQLTTTDLEDRFQRGQVKHVIAGDAHTEKLAAIPGDYTRVVVGAARPGWRPFEDLYGGASTLAAEPGTKATDPMLLYFTSGTTAKPKLVLHTHQSYPVGHLLTMYWVGVRPGDVHLNISSPGWAKHAWSSFFAPWNAEATVLAHDYQRFVPARTREVLRTCGVSTLCAPPTVWRMFILDELGERPGHLREMVSAGEPLNPEVIERVRAAWGITMRDGYGQTETTAQIGNPPGQPLTLGSMGRPLPGYRIALVGPDGREGSEGEIRVRLGDGGEVQRPLGLMVGYLDDPARTEAAMSGGYYHTGDEAQRDAEGAYLYVARHDDVFKSSDYRISPFELESALLEHAAVAEAAVVPSPDDTRHTVPKAFIVLKPGVAPTREVAKEIFEFVKSRLAPYKRVRRIEFSNLPKTISGKIRRVQLRELEKERRAQPGRADGEFFLEDF